MAERFCNKCGYFGPDQLHQRPNGTGQCDYLSMPSTVAPPPAGAQQAVADALNAYGDICFARGAGEWPNDPNRAVPDHKDHDRAFAAVLALAAPAAAQTETDLPYLAERLLDFTCRRVDNAGGTPGLTLYYTKLGAHPEYQLYSSEAFALWTNLGKALSATPAPEAARRIIDSDVEGED